MNLVLLIVVVIIINNNVTVAPPMILNPDLLLRLGRIRRSSCLNGSTNAVGLYPGKTMTQWLILRNYSAAADLLAGCYRILELAVGVMVEMGTGIGIGAGGGDDLFFFLL